MPIKSLLIVLLLFGLIWVPVLLDHYDLLIAVILTLSIAVVGYLGDKIRTFIKEKQTDG